MSRARSAFFESISTLRDLVQESLLTDQGPLNPRHNRAARALRSGLTVSAYSSMETYLEEVSTEHIAGLSKASFKYRTFGEDLRMFLTVEAVKGLANRSNFMLDADRLQFIEAELPRLATFRHVKPKYTGLGFSPVGSNVGERDFWGLLKSFGVGGGWNTLSAICANLGFSSPTLQDQFRNFLQARNSSAHDSSNDVPSATLAQHIDTAVLVGISIDIALQNAVEAFCSSADFITAVQQASATVSYTDFRYVDEQVDGTWEESYGNSRTAVHASRDMGAQAARRRPPRRVVVLRDVRRFPIGIFS